MRKFCINILLTLIALLILPFYLLGGAIAGLCYFMLAIFQAFYKPIEAMICVWTKKDFKLDEAL